MPQEPVEANASGNKKWTTVYDPTSVPVTERPPDFVPRINAFNGKRVGLWWNGKPNGNFFLDRVAGLLEKRFEGIRITRFWEVDPGTAYAGDKSAAVLDNMAKSSDILIAAQGD